MKTLELVGHRRFSSPHIEEDVVLKGGQITVTDDLAEKLCEARVMDVANNAHHVWREVSTQADEPKGAPVAAAPKATARKAPAPKAVARKASPRRAAKKTPAQ